MVAKSSVAPLAANPNSSCTLPRRSSVAVAVRLLVRLVILLVVGWLIVGVVVVVEVVVIFVQLCTIPIINIG